MTYFSATKFTYLDSIIEPILEINWLESDQLPQEILDLPVLVVSPTFKYLSHRTLFSFTITTFFPIPEYQYRSRDSEIISSIRQDLVSRENLDIQQLGYSHMSALVKIG